MIFKNLDEVAFWKSCVKRIAPTPLGDHAPNTAKRADALVLEYRERIEASRAALDAAYTPFFGSGGKLPPAPGENG